MKDEAPVQEPVGTYGEIFNSMLLLLRSGTQRDQQIYMAMQDRPLYTSPPAQPAPVHDLPFGVGGGLVAIKTLLSRDPCVHANTAIEMIDAILKEHPAVQPAPVREPVAWMHEWDDGERIPMLRKREVDSSDIDSPKSVRPLVFGDTTPPAAKRQWVGLTPTERKQIEKRYVFVEDAIRLTEAKLKEKNNG